MCLIINFKLNVYSKLTMTMCSLKLPIIDFVQMDFVHTMAENGWLISNIQKKIAKSNKTDFCMRNHNN